MQLAPHYGSDPVLVLDGAAPAVLGPLVRQRRRLAAALATFDADQWAHPSRCDAWTTREVVLHLESTNNFWIVSIASGRDGAPTQFLRTFDPSSTPDQLIASSLELAPSEALDRFVASTESLVTLVESLGDDVWSLAAEAPPGHISISAVAHHALWDSWVHERDILLPLGMPVDEEPDEITACLRYGAALGPALARTRGVGEQGVLAIDTVGPDVTASVAIGDQVVVHAGRVGEADLVLTGSSVELLEAFSVRRPFDQQIPPSTAWMLRGLLDQFEG